jgi:hypothetical protein
LTIRTSKRWTPEFRLNILLEVSVIKRDCQPLLDRGADPDVVVQVVSALKSDPLLRYAPTLLRNVRPDYWAKTSVEIRKLADTVGQCCKGEDGTTLVVGQSTEPSKTMFALQAVRDDLDNFCSRN